MTTADIAKKLNLSRSTVSRILNNHPGVKESTRELVLDELKKQGYTPNEAARALVLKKKFRIAVVVFSEPDFFWEQIHYGVNQASSEIRLVGGEVEYFVTDILHPEEQLALLKKLPEEGFDAIAVAPNNTQMLIEEVDRLSLELQLPVVLLNVDIPTANRLCYVGCSYLQSGILAAELLAKFIAGSGDIAVLTLQDQVTPIEQRVIGFQSEIKRFPGVSIRTIRRYNRKGEGVYGDVKQLLRVNPEIRGIYVSFGASEQASDAVLDTGNCGKVQVVGYDLSQPIAHYLNSGALSATICHEPFKQGYLAVRILYQFLMGHKTPMNSVFHTKLEVIMKNNADDYLNECEDMLRTI